MYRSPPSTTPENVDPQQPPDEPQEEPPVEDGATMPATYGSRRRAREALEATRVPAPRDARESALRAPQPEGRRAPDLTFWLIAGSIVTFLALLLLAVLLYTFGQVRRFSTTPTLAAAIAPTVSQNAEVSPPATATEPQPVARPTLAETATQTTYVVQAGDSLGTIAQTYAVSVDDILKANGLANPDLVYVGQTLIIPVSTTMAITPPPVAATPVTPLTTALPTASSAAANLPRSILEGDLGANYPLALTGPRLTIHYQPGSFTDTNGPELILNHAEQTLAFIEQRLDVTYSGPLDVYLAGSLFEAPDQALRGRAFSTENRLVVLYDSSGTPEERRYMLAHEMTHVVAWHTYGAPSAVMLSEGLATYVGQPYLEGFIQYRDFCRALLLTNRLPSLASIQNSSQAFLGHIRNLYNYDTAACFVGYLMDQKGQSVFSQLYTTANYTSNFGEGLGQLEIDFQNGLSANAGRPLGFDPVALVSDYDEVRAGYEKLLANSNPDPKAYDVLDKARIAVMQGEFATSRARLDEFHALAP